MVRIVKGMQAAVNRDAERAANFGDGDFIRYMRVSDDKDIARFRIVSEHEEELCAQSGLPTYMITTEVHRHNATSSTGKTYFTSTPCTMDQDADGNWFGECSFCDSDIRRTEQFLLWVFVYDVYHIRQNTDISNPWPQDKLGHKLVYREPVNQFMVWQDGYYSRQELNTRSERNGSLTDRDYERTRQGARGYKQSKYILEALEISPIRQNILEKAQRLPDLSEVLLGNIKTWNDIDMESDVPRQAPQPQVAHTEVEISPPLSVVDFDDLPF